MTPVYKLSDAKGLTGTTTYYSSMLAGNTAYSPIAVADPYDLLESQVLSTTPTSVTFSNLVSSYATDYEHLHLTLLTNRTTQSVGALYMEFNGDTNNANYYYHNLYGSGSSASANRSIAFHTGTSTIFTGSLIDILHPFDTNRYTVSRNLHGVPGTSEPVALFQSHLWKNTNQVDSITFKVDANNFPVNSRFSLYGTKKASA